MGQRQEKARDQCVSVRPENGLLSALGTAVLRTPLMLLGEKEKLLQVRAALGILGMELSEDLGPQNAAMSIGLVTGFWWELGWM